MQSESVFVVMTTKFNLLIFILVIDEIFLFLN